MYDSVLAPNFVETVPLQHFPAEAFPWIHPVHWLQSHFAVGGWSPLQRLSGMLTAHMTAIAPHNGFTWHPHRGLEIYTCSTGGQGDIGPGELQRMFSGDWIEHQELNQGDAPVRVIQIWFAADIKHRGLEPHYQQLPQTELPACQRGDATTYRLIGDQSPMAQHMTGRLSATVVPAGGQTRLEAPRPGEDLFLYITDGAGRLCQPNAEPAPLGQYDVLLARPDTPLASLAAGPGQPLNYLSFYLKQFLSKN